VGEYLYGFAAYLEMENPQQLFLLGAFHDIGKIKIPTSVLNKKESLTGQEFDEIKRHTLYGENIIKNVTEFPPDFSKAILYHHENIDGSGYYKIAGDNIPLLSRIIRIVDSYDTMIYGRIYQEPVRQDQVLQEMRSLSGKHYDKKLMEVYTQFLDTKYALNPFILLENSLGT
jgi:HD-GYP domain-containing protein (c-di-GMP phosphodiesterase class II)